MYTFSNKSTARLSTCHPDLITLATGVIMLHDCSVFQGYRDEATQNKYFTSGTSKVQFPNSKHNQTPSMAIDLAPYVKGRNSYDMDLVIPFAEIVMDVAQELYSQGIIEHKVRWGGDWNMNGEWQDESFFDGIHFELIY